MPSHIFFRWVVNPSQRGDKGASVCWSWGVRSTQLGCLWGGVAAIAEQLRHSERTSPLMSSLAMHQSPYRDKHPAGDLQGALRNRSPQFPRPAATDTNN